MKKTFFYIGCLVLLVAGCNKVETEVTPVEEPAVESTRHLTVDINVEYPGDTRSLKTGWEEGDKIYVAFDHYFSDVLKPASGTSEKAYYMTLTYPGNSWASEFSDPALEDYLLEEVEGQERSGLLAAAYFSDLAPLFEYAYQNRGPSADEYRVDVLNGMGAPGFYLFDNGESYSVADDKLTASLQMKLPDNMVHFFLEGVGPDDYQRFSLKCDLIAPAAVANFNSLYVYGDWGEVYAEPNVSPWDWRDRYGEAIPAALRSDGIAFCGFLKNVTDQDGNVIETIVGQEAEYFIQVIDNNGTPEDSSDDIIHTLTKTATLNSKDAVKLPALDSGRWVDYKDALIRFQSDAVKEIAIAKWDTSRDGELSYGEAAAVTSLEGEFSNHDIDNPKIPAETEFTFDELQYFTGLTSIGEYEFANTSLTSVVLPPAITSIEMAAFANTKIKSIAIPESVTKLGAFAFEFTPLQELYIPASVTDIRSIPTDGCNDLSVITVSADNPKYASPWGSNAIVEISTKTLVVGCVNTVIPDGVVKIGQNAFTSYSNLHSIQIPTSVREIGPLAFWDTGLQSVVIPETVTTIGIMAFYNFNVPCELASIVDLAPNPQPYLQDMLGAVDLTFPIYVPNESVDDYKGAWPYYADRIKGMNIEFASEAVKNIAVANWDKNLDGELSYAEAAAVTSLDGAFKSILSNTVFTFDELQYFTGLTCIGDHEFENTSLTSVVLPPTIQSIGYSAFGNTKITSIVIPEGVSVLSHFVFEYTPLQSLHIPASLTEMISNPVVGCENLTSITVAEGNPVYSSPENCNAIVVTSAKTLFAGCVNTVIPDDIETIGYNAFNGCINLHSIEIPSSVTVIQDAAFAYTGLRTVVIPESVTTIGSMAFLNYEGENELTCITILATNPQPSTDQMLGAYSESFPICVPDASIAAYKAAWPDYADRIRGLLDPGFSGFKDEITW